MAPNVFLLTFFKLGPLEKWPCKLIPPNIWDGLKIIYWSNLYHTCPFLGAFCPENILPNKDRTFFLYLLLGVPFSLAWKLSFQPNMNQVIFPLSCSSTTLLHNCIHSRFFQIISRQFLYKREDMFLFLI